MSDRGAGAAAAAYREFGGRIYRFALRMSGRGSIAEDVTQEVFLALLAEPQRFDASRGSLASFLYGIARHQVLKVLEREGARARLTSAIPTELPPGDPLEALMQRERVDRVWRALLALAPHHREVLVLCELEHLPYDEAARVLGCPLGTVRSRLHRARALLAEALRESPGEESGTLPKPLLGGADAL